MAPGNHCVIQNQWRYIRYKEGTEELYNLKSDPDEFTNLANRTEYAVKKKEMAAHLPKEDAPMVQVNGRRGRRGTPSERVESVSGQRTDFYVRFPRRYSF